MTRSKIKKGKVGYKKSLFLKKLKKKSLGVERECNVEKKVAYVCCFRDPKSLGVERGDRSIFVFAYLTALLRGHFLILAYLTWF